MWIKEGPKEIRRGCVTRSVDRRKRRCSHQGRTVGRRRHLSNKIRRGFRPGRPEDRPLSVSTIRKKASGRYEARYRDPSGRSRGKTFTTRKAAKEFLDRTGTDIGDR